MLTEIILLITALEGLVENTPPVIKLTGNQNSQEAQRPIFDKDDGGGLSFEEDKPRIDRFAVDMKKNNSANAYIIAYGGLLSYKHEARIRLKCIRDYLSTAHGISHSRLKLIDGGYRPEISVELFLVKPEDPKPTAYPIVNREAVRMRRAPKYPCSKSVK